MLLLSNMKKIGVIGLGNPLRRDDGIGIVLLEKLVKHRHKLPKNIQFIDGGTGGMNIFHMLVQFDTVLIIDAAFFTDTPGNGRFFSLQEIKNNRISFVSLTHEFDIFRVINLAKELKIAPKHILFFCIQPKDTSFGTSLSKEIQQKIEDLLKKLIIELKKICKESL